MEVSGQLHAPATLSPGTERPVPILDTRLGEPQNRSEIYGVENNSAPTGNRTVH
jgi:hypothetical protein